MPIYSVQGPDGRIYDVEGPAGASEEQIIAVVKQQIAQQPKPSEGVLAAVGKGAESALSALRAGVKGVVAPEEAAREARLREEDIQRRYAEQVSLDRVKKAYQERGLLPAAGEVISQVPYALAEQAPNIATTLAGARLGAMAGAAFGPVGGVVGGLAGAVAPSFFQQAGGNIQRQAAEGQPISRAAAYGAAAPQAALDVAATFVPLGRTLAGKALGPGVAKMLEKGAEEGAEKLAKETLLKTLAKGTAVGAMAEIPTEVTQQMLERVQAGLPLLSEDALKEYGETAYQTSLLAPIGAAGRVAERGAARERVEVREELERGKALKEQREQERLAEEKAAAEKQTPEYALNFMQQHDALQKEYNDLGELLKQKLPPGASFAEKQTYEAQKKRRNELATQLKEQAPEYNRAKAIAAPVLQAQAAARAAEQQRAAQEQQTRMQEEQLAGPMQQLSIPGMEPQVLGEAPEAAPEGEAVDYAAQANNLRNYLDELRTKAQTTKVLSEKLALGEEFSRVQKALKEAEVLASQAPKPADKQLELLRKKMEVAEEEGDIDAQVKLAKKLQEMGITDLSQIGAQQGLDLGKPRELPPLETRSQFAARVYKPGAPDIEAQEQALREEETRAEEQRLADERRQQRLAPEVVALRRVAERPVPRMQFAMPVEAEKLVDRIMAATDPAQQSRVITSLTQQLSMAPATMRYDRATALLRDLQEKAKTAEGDEKVRLERRATQLERAQNALGKEVNRRLFDITTDLGEQGLVPRNVLKPTGEARRVPGGFQLFGEAEPAAREVTREELQERLTRAMASNRLSDEAYDFLSRVENVLPEQDRDGFYGQLDAQLRRIESGEEGMARPGAGRVTTLQAFPAEGRADVAGATLANAEDRARRDLYQKKLKEGMAPDAASALVFKASREELIAAAEAENPALARTIKTASAAVTKRPARDIGEDTLRGPSAKAVPLSLQAELEPFVEQAERAREEDAGQMALFPSEQKKLAVTRATPEEFQQYLGGEAAERLRKQAEPVEKKVARAREKLDAVNDKISELTGTVNEIEDALANAYPFLRLNALREELAALESLPRTNLGEYSDGVTQRMGALREALRVAEEQETKLIEARSKLKTEKIQSLQDELAAVQKDFGSVLQAVARRGQLKAAVNELQLSANQTNDFIDTMKVSDEDKRLLKEQLADNPLGKHLNSLNTQFSSLSTALARVDAVARVSEADRRVREYEAQKGGDRTVLAMAKRELRAAQAAASKLKKDIGALEARSAAQEGVNRRAQAARNKAEAELKRTAKYKAQQATLERQQKAPEGVDQFGQPLRSMAYDPITDAQRAAREDDTPTILADEMRQVRGNPQQVLKGYRAYISTLTKKLQEAYDTARRQTVEGVKERAPYEAALRAYTEAKTSEARANLMPIVNRLETAYNDAVTNALNARVMPKGLVGYQEALTEMLRREAWLKNLIDTGTVEVAEPPKPRKRKTDAELKEIQSVLTEKEFAEAAARVGAPALDITATTKSEIEAERKPKGTLYSSKGVGQETLLDEDAIKERKEQQTLLRKTLTPEEKATFETNTIIKQARDKVQRKEPLTELEQLLLGDYNRSRLENKAALLRQNKFKLEAETAVAKGRTAKEETAESFEDIAQAEREEADREFAEVEVAEPDIADLFGVGRKSKAEYLAAVQEEIGAKGESILGRVATARGQLKDIQRQLDFIEANKRGPEVDGKPTLSPKQEARQKELLAEKEAATAKLASLEARLSKIKAPAPDTLQQLAATASQGPALKEEVDSEKSAAVVMSNIAESTTNDLTRAVADRLKLLLGNTRVEIVNDLRDPDGQAAYGQAAADGSFIRLDAKYGLNERTAVHEGVHAATERVIQMPEDQLTDDQRRAKRELEELFEAYKKLKGATNENAKTSLSEFASEALSDDVMQAEMRQQKWTLRHMWDSFKSALLRMLGIKTPENMLEATLAAVDNLMTKVPRPTQADNALLAPKVLNQPRNLNPALAEADAFGRSIVAGNQSWWQPIRAKSSGLAMETGLVDRFAGFERLSKYMDKLKGTQMMYYLRMYDQRMNFTAQSVANGALDVREVQRRDGEREFIVESQTGPSLRQVAVTLKGAARLVGDVDATSRLFTLYLAAKRAERVGFDKLDLRDPKITEQKLRDTVAQVRSVEGLQDIFDNARDIYNQYNENLVRFAQKAGVLSKKDADALLASKDYIPWYRERNGVAELALGGLTPIKLGNVKDMPHLQELVGGDKPILDFMISSVQNTNMMVDLALRNLATRNAMFELLDLGMAKITSKPVDGPEVVRFKHNGEDRYAVLETDTVEVGGKKVNTGVNADILVKGMEGIPLQTTGILRAVTIPTQLLRRAVTLNPLYMVRQLMRDSLAASIASGADFPPVLGALREIESSAKGTLERRGITGGQMFTGTQEDLSKIMRDLVGGRSAITKTLGALEWAGMEADALTRRAQYNSYIKQGMSEMEATLLSLESMNFNKRGASPSAHMANSLYPFFNAQVQGLNVLYRAMFGQITAGERARIKAKLITRGAMLMAATLAYAHAMQDDEAYKNALPAEKYGNWFIRLPGVSEPLRIPIPFEIGYIFKALPEALYNTIVNERGGEQAKEALLGILRNTIPGGSAYFIPQAMKPAIEVMTNYSMFTERPLLSAKEQALLPEYQYREKTTELAKLFGGATGVSPIKLEALISGYFSTMGMALLQAASLPIPTKDTPEKATKRLSDMPVVGSAFQPNDARWVINSTYDALDDSRKVQSSFNELVNRGDKAEARALLDARANEYARAELAGYYRQEMGELTKVEAAIRASNKTPDEKRALLDRIQQVKIKLSSMVRDASDAAKLREV
jgi:hypothetical protein